VCRFVILSVLYFVLSSFAWAQESQVPAVSGYQDLQTYVVESLEKAKLSPQQKLALIPVFQSYNEALTHLEGSLQTSTERTTQFSDTLDQERQARRQELLGWQWATVGLGTAATVELSYIVWLGLKMLIRSSP
jgi:hypothetical protein